MNAKDRTVPGKTKEPFFQLCHVTQEYSKYRQQQSQVSISNRRGIDRIAKEVNRLAYPVVIP